MITVTAYNPAKSPMAFGSTGKSKKVSPHVSAVKTPVAYKNKSTIQSVRTFFKALPLALGLGAMTPAFNSCDPIDVPDKPVTKLSPTQKQFATIINTMYGSGEESAARIKSSVPSVANDLTYMPDTLITESGTERQVEVFDKSNPDTIKSKYTSINTYNNSNEINMEYDKKYYLKDGILIEEVPKFSDKIPTVINEKGNVVKTYFSHPYEYIKESNTKTIERVISNGKENIIRVIKKI